MGSLITHRCPQHLLLCSTGVSPWRPLGSSIVTVSLQVQVTPSMPQARAQRESVICHLSFLHWGSLFTFSVGFNSHVSTLPGAVDPPPSFFPPLCCILVSGLQVSERLFVCCSALHHLPRRSISLFPYFFSFLFHVISGVKPRPFALRASGLCKIFECPLSLSC